MRIAGRDDNGVAKAIKTDTRGVVYTQKNNEWIKRLNVVSVNASATYTIDFEIPYGEEIIFAVNTNNVAKKKFKLDIRWYTDSFGGADQIADSSIIIDQTIVAVFSAQSNLINIGGRRCRIVLHNLETSSTVFNIYTKIN